MTRQRKCYSMDEELSSRVTRVAIERGLPDSEIVNKYVTKGLSQEEVLTSVERYHIQRKKILNALDSVLRIIGILEFDGGVGDKYRVALYACHGKQRHNNRKYRDNLLEQSLFEVLNDIAFMDVNLFTELRAELRYFGRMQARFNSIYTKQRNTWNTED